ncbi:MAG: hypothetical protein IRZ32_02020, partial [Solirubrobacteraceae bacterium]|nr:hypothetical protein [Solirubrobacteraceae bacterium]
PAPVTGGPAPAAAGRVAAAVQVGHVRVAGGRLRAVVRVDPRAARTVAVRLRARGRTVRFAVAVPASGEVRVDRALPRALRGATSGEVTVGVPGDAGAGATEVRLRAAGRPARLSRPAARVRGADLVLSGTISPRAAGRVRVRVQYVAADGRVRTAAGAARIRRGRWSVTMAAPGDAAGGPLQVTARYAGSAARDLTGAQTVATVVR